MIQARQTDSELLPPSNQNHARLALKSSAKRPRGLLWSGAGAGARVPSGLAGHPAVSPPARLLQRGGAVLSLTTSDVASSTFCWAGSIP